MWSRITGKSNDAGNDDLTQSSRRKSNEQASKRHRSESTVSSSTTRQKASKSDDRDRGFTPTSTSFASTTKSPYPNTASPSVAVSHSVVGDKIDGQYIPPGLVRNASLADRMPKSKAGRDEREIDRERNRKSEGRKKRSLSGDRTQGEKERSRSRDRGDKNREKKEKRDKKDKDRVKDRGLSRSESGYGDDYGTSRALPDFAEQVGSAGFMQFPGQYDAGFIGGPQASPAGISSHVQDQFPGQFPIQSAEPYRPPLAVSEGGPGLAAEYYGDAGQSVSDQPGVRLQSPSLIIGAEPHLQAASAVAAPPPEPSTTGGVGAAASFFDGSFTPEPAEGLSATQAPIGTSGPPFYQDSNTGASTARPDPSHHSSSAPAVPTLGAAAAGAAAGYLMSGGQSSQSQRPEHVPSAGNGSNLSPSSSTYQRPSSHLPSTSGSITNNSKPTKPAKHSSQSSNIPMYAAGAAGLAALHNNHQSSAPSHPAVHHHSTISVAQQHRHRGPFSQFVDFFKDPEGVAQFEEYTEYIGVCRYCFAPGSSPRDAPRKHHYRRRRSNEYLGSSTRVDKEGRYGSSDGEGRRRNKKSSWLTTGVAGYGLAKVGESLFNQKNGFDDTYSGRTGYPSSTHGTHGSRSPDRRSITSRGVTRRSSDTHSHRRSRSNERVEKGITRDGRVYKKDPHGSIFGGPSTTVYGSRHGPRARSRSRSRSRDRKNGVAGAVLGTAIGSSVVASGFHPRSRSPKKASVSSKQRSREHSPDLPSVLRVSHPESHHASHRLHHSPSSSHRHRSHNKEKKGGFFTFGNGSSSSSDGGGFFSSGRKKQRGSKKSKANAKDHSNADVALMGAAAAAAALALNEGRQRNKSKRIGDLVAVKESKGKLHRGSHRNLPRQDLTMSGPEDHLWESASEDESDSADSALAYGLPARRRRSQGSLSSESSGTGLWDWRWGSKKKAKDQARVNTQNSDDNFGTIATATVADAATAGLVGTANGMSSGPRNQRHVTGVSNDSSIPLQFVHPVPTSDPSRFDVTRANSIASSNQPIMYSRPGPVPIQHPQPIAPVSQTVYSAQVPYGHSYSAPTGPPVFSQAPHEPQPSMAVDGRHAPLNMSQVNMPGMLPAHDQLSHRDAVRDVKPRRRDTSPAAHYPQVVSKSTTPRRRSSLKEDSSAVRFDLTEEQEDKARRKNRGEFKEDEELRLQRERREKHRQEKEEEEVPIQSERRDKRREAREEELAIENERWEAAEQTQIDKDRKASRRIPAKESPSDKDKSWVAPVTAGAVAAAVGAAVAAESSKKDAERDERREKRRRERMSSRDETATSHRQKSPEEVVKYVYYADEQSSTTQQKPITYVPQAASKTGNTGFEYEDYASFFTPPELASSSRESKERATSLNADSDITVYQTPEIITREPSRLHDSSRAPAFSYAPDELVSDRDYPSWLPKLNLIEPTPPASRASSTRGAPSPVMEPIEEIVKQEKEQTPTSTTAPKVTWGEPETHEYTVITPMEHRDQLIDSPQRATDSDEDIPEVQDRDTTTSQRQNPSANGVSAGHGPGYYGNDLEFAATLAAGLEGTGFDPAIVVDDPVFRRRDSPPGSEKVGVAEEVSIAEEASRRQRDSPKRDLEDPPWSTMPGSFDDEEDFGPKLSKKDQKKRDKAAKRQNATDPSIDQYIDEVSPSRKIVSKEPEPLDQMPTDTFDKSDDRNKNEKNKESKSDESSEDGARETYLDSSPKSQSRATEDGSFDAAVLTPRVVKSKDQQHKATAHLLGDIPLPVDDEQYNLDDRRITSGPLDDAYYYDKKSKSRHSRSSRDRDESFSDDAPSVAETAPVSTEKSNGKKHRKKSKRSSSGFDDAASAASSPAAIDDSRDSKKSSKKEKERKGGMFGLFSKATDNLSESHRAKETSEEAALDDFEEPKRSSKKSKDRRSSHNDEISSQAGGDLEKFEEDEEKDRSHKSRDQKEDRRASSGSTLQHSGRSTQDLPAKDQESTRSRETTRGKTKRATESKDEQESMSFLGMRQEIPPSPDIPTATPKPPGNRIETETRDLANILTYAVDDLALLEENRRTILADRERHVNLPSASNSQPTSPLSHSEGRSLRLSGMKIVDSTKAPANTASPTAVPFRWKEPPLSPSFSRSSPSTPLSSLSQPPDSVPIRSKTRPRSTEFKGSTEFRPLWLVERHGSRQEPASEEIYPSLPSSHTTSRASSVHDPEDTNVDQDVGYDLAQSYFEPVGERRGLVIDTEKATAQSDLLDSQEPTPTASSFHAAERGEKSLDVFQNQPSVPTGEIITTPGTDDLREASNVPKHQTHKISDLFPYPRQASPSRYSHEPSPGLSSTPAERGNPEVSIDDPSTRETSSLQKAIETAAIAGGSTVVAIAATSHHDQRPGHGLSEPDVFQPHEDDKALISDVDRSAADANYFPEADFLIKKSKKAKKKDAKRSEASPNQKPELPTPITETSPLSPSNETGRLSVEEQMALQERDAQDAVDSWFAPVTLKKSKKDKKGKKKDQSVDFVEEPQSAASIAVTPADISKAAVFSEDAAESMEAPVSGIAVKKNVQIETSRHTEPTSDDPSTLSKTSERDQLSKGMPASEVVGVMTAVAQATKASERELSKSDPVVDRPSVEDERQAFSGKFKKKGKKNKKASFGPREDDTIGSLQADVGKPSNIHTSIGKDKQQGDFVSFNDTSAGEASQEESQEPEGMDKQVDSDAPKESYEFPLLLKKKGKKSRTKAESISQPNTPLETPTETPHQASRSLDGEQNPFEARLLSQKATVDTAPDAPEPVPTPAEELDSNSTQAEKTKKSKKGRKSLRDGEDVEPVVPAMEEATGVHDETPKSSVPIDDQIQDQHGPGPFPLGSEVEREYHQSTDRSAGLEINPWVSPEATPLPLNDDIDLLDALPMSPLIIAADISTGDLHSGDHRLDEPAHEGSFSLDHTIQRELAPPEAVPLPPDTDVDLSDVLPPSPIVEQIEPNSGRVRPSDIEPRDLAGAFDTLQVSGPTQEVSREVPVEDANETPDGHFTFATKKKSKKGKKSKQGLSLEPLLDLASEEGSRASPSETIQAPREGSNVQYEAGKGVVETPEEPLPVDEWAVPSKKKGKNGKKQRLLAETIESLQLQEKDLSALPPSSQLVEEDSQARDVIAKQDYKVSQESSARDEWASFGKKGKKGKKQKYLEQEPMIAALDSDKSTPSHLELEQSEPKVPEVRQFQAELASNASFVDLPHLRNSEDKEVQADASTELMPTSDKPLLIGESDSQNLPESTKQQSIHGNERAMPIKKKWGKKGRRSDFKDFDDSLAAPEVKDEKSIGDAPMATTETAREVQDMLAEANKAPTSSDPFGESVEDDRALTRDPLDMPMEIGNADDFGSETTTKKKEEKGKVVKLLLSNDHNTEEVAPVLPEAQPKTLPESLPLPEEPLVGTSREAPSEKTENEESRPFILARTQSEPITSLDGGSGYTGLGSSIVAPVMTSFPEAEEIEQSRALSPETAALLSRDDEKPPGALKAADVVPDPELDSPIPSEGAPIFGPEADVYGTPLAPIIEDRVSGIEGPSTASHAELSIPNTANESTTSPHAGLGISGPTDKFVDSSGVPEQLQEPVDGAQGASAHMPPLSKKEKQRAEKGRKLAWDDVFDSPTPESKALPDIGSEQKDVASTAPGIPTDAHRDVVAHDFEGFPECAKVKEKSKKARFSTWDEEVPSHTPESDSVPIIGEPREVSTLEAGKATSNNVGVYDIEGFGKGKEVKKAFAWEDDGTASTPEPLEGRGVATVEDPILTQPAFSEPEEPSISKDSEPVINEFAAALKNKNDKEKAKKSKAFSWDDEGTTNTPEELEEQESVILGDEPAMATTASNDPEPSVSKEPGATTEEIFVASESKKDKKKLKSKRLSWEEDTLEQVETQEIATVAEDPEVTQTILNEPEMLSVLAESEPATGDFSPPKSKKDKKKAKKSKSLSWEVKGTSTSERTEAQELATTAKDPPVAERVLDKPREPPILKESNPITNDFDESSKTKKGKKSKKSKLPSWEEETPATFEALEAPELLEAMHESSKKSILERELTKSIQSEIATTADPAIDTFESFPTNRKHKKKAKKKSKGISWEHESGTVTPEVLEAQVPVMAFKSSSQEPPGATGDARELDAGADRIAAEKALQKAIISMAPPQNVCSQSIEGSSIDTGRTASSSDKDADESSSQSLQQEVVQESGHMDFVQPFEKPLEAHRLGERCLEIRPAEPEGALATGSGEAKQDPSSIKLEEKMGEPIEKDHLPDIQPVEDLPEEFANDTLPTMPTYTFEDKSQDYQAPIERAVDTPQDDLTTRDIAIERQPGIVEPEDVPTLDAQLINKDKKDGDEWDMPVKKGKKGKKQRNGKSLASNISQASEDPYTMVPEDRSKALDSIIGDEQPLLTETPVIPSLTGETSGIAIIRDDEEPGNGKSIRNPNPKASQPSVEKNEPALPSADVKGFEDQNIAVGETLLSQDDFSTFTITKKGKKGKKGKKQQAPIIWEDEAAAEPVLDQTDVVADEAADSSGGPAPVLTSFPADYTQQSHVREAEEEQHRQDKRIHEQYNDSPSAFDEFSGTVEEPSQIKDTSDDYFGLSHSGDSKQVEGRDGGHPPAARQEGFEPDFPTEPQQSGRTTDALEAKDETAKTIEEQRAAAEIPVYEEQAEPDWDFASTKKGKNSKNKDAEMESGFLPIEQDLITMSQQSQRSMEALGVTNMAPGIAGQERALGGLPPSEEQAEPDWSYASTKKSKKGKKSKRNIEIEKDAPPVEQDLFTGPQEAQRSPCAAEDTDQAPEISGQERAGEEQSETDWGYAPVKKGKKGKKSKTKDVYMDADTPSSGPQRSSDLSEGLSAPSESRDMEGITAAAAAGLGLGIITDEGLQRKDSKKEGKKGKKNMKASKWTEFEDEEAPKPSEQDNYGQVQAQAWVQEQQGASVPPQHRFQDTPPLSPPKVPRDTMMEGVSYEAQPLQSDYPINRDSAIQMSDSPVVAGRGANHRVIRDSGFQDMETSPVFMTGSEHGLKTKERQTKDAESGMEHHESSLQRHQRQGTSADNPFDVSVEVSPEYAVSVSRPRPEGHHHDFHENNDRHSSNRRSRDLTFDDLREPSPVSSTTKDRSSVLFQSSPSTREELADRPQEHPSSPHYPIATEHSSDQGSKDLAGEVRSKDLPTEHPSVVAAERALHMTSPTGNAGTSLFGGPVGIVSDVKSPPRSPFSPDGSSRRKLDTITEYSPEESLLHKKGRHLSDVGLPEHGIKSLRRSSRPQSLSQQRVLSPPAREDPPKKLISTDDLIARLSWPPVDEDKHAVDLERSRSRSRNTDHSHHGNGPAAAPRESDRRSVSGASIRSGDSINAIIRTPDQVRSVSGQSFRSSGTPPLRRVDHRVSGDLRLANKKSEAKLAKELEAEEHDIAIPSSSTYDPIKDKGKTKVRDMADVFEGWGDVHGQSPISPTRPPSMRRRQSLQVLDLETKLDQLLSENRLLQNAKSNAERSLEEVTHSRNSEIENFQVAIQTRDTFLGQKDAELNELKHVLQGLQSQVAQLTEVNQGLSETSRGIDDHKQRHSQLEAEHANTHQQWQRSLVELDELRQQHSQLSAGMEDIVRHEVNVALEEKNLELRKVHDELEATKEQVRVLQRQILAAKNSDDFIVARDEDYFDEQCQKLCQHVQQWVLRFSKFSDMRACFLASEIRDETVVDRFENAILDGSDVDGYLVDRVKRRDVFMSVVMTMIFDYIFTRYLFGMDREQRQKLKSLQSTLSEVGPMAAVHKWRATTLTLLSRREAFAAQRAQDTEAVMVEIYKTLATFLPPPSHLVNQIQESLRKVISAAVDLHIEMRTQRAEYVMLPPLQPEYDTNGDLARKVYFNSALMNERSGDTSSNDALEAQHAVVRMVLFPLVVKRGDDSGIGDEEIVVCPAQVLTAKPGKEKKTVRVMSVAGSTAGGRSVASLGGSDVGMGNMI